MRTWGSVALAVTVMILVFAFIRWSQLVDATLYLSRKRWSVGDVSKISSRLHSGRENGVMGSLAARGVAEGDWPSV
jgi:hypothetical protein